MTKILMIEPGSNRRNPKKIRVVYGETEFGGEKIVTFSRSVGSCWERNSVYLLFKLLLMCSSENLDKL